jgi:hypothetical protein
MAIFSVGFIVPFLLDTFEDSKKVREIFSLRLYIDGPDEGLLSGADGLFFIGLDKSFRPA